MSSYATEQHRDSTASAASNSSVKSALKSAARRYKEHNRSIQAAWEAHYGVYPSAPSSRRASEQSTSSTSSAKKAWNSVKERVSEHHRGVNQAYIDFYGGSEFQRRGAQA